MFDAIASAYGSSTTSDSKQDALSFKRGLHRQDGDSCGDTVMKDGSSKWSDSEKSWSTLSAFMLEKGNVLGDEQSKK